MLDNLAGNQLHLASEEKEDAPHVEYNIASYPSDFTLSGLNDMYEKGDIVIPDYQRGFVWSIRQASLLVDSFLRGLPVPAVFFYIGKSNEKIVIDGQQRLKSIAYYFEGYFGEAVASGKRAVFRLTGLDRDNPYHNKSFAELEGSAQRKFENAVLRAVNIEQLDPKGEDTSAYYIFERLNTGGTPLRPQEIRNVIYRGKFNDDLKEANGDANWRKILGMQDPDKHQKDVELLLRVFAFVVAGDRYKKPMKEFINKKMKEYCNSDAQEVKCFFGAFSKATEMVVRAVGEKPFHLESGRLNGPALDTVMSVLLKGTQRLDHIDIKARYHKLRTDDDFLKSVRGKTTDTDVVQSRIKRVEEILLG